MLRVNIKKQLLDIIDIIENIHKKCKLENENIFIVLEECYGAVFSIKINFGHIFKNDLFTLRILDEYLEKVNNILDNQNINLEKLDYLISCIEKLKKAVFEYKAVRQVAFFPYKAEMWDSLESVWKAFQKDTDWECLVVPIPYSKFNKKKQEWIPCYDGANFPKGIPIVDYHIYFVEEEKPDVAFIHNPYDEYNLVTRVDSRYFSHELKKYVNKLVYIPYYLNARTVSDNHLNLSAYKYVDYIMVQSEAFRKRFINTPYYNKVKAFGSPKLDRVIHMNNMQLELLSDWKEILEGKKIVLLNTSLKSFLKDGRLYLEKLHILFQQFNKYKNSVALLWRPHPLFKATIESMRPELLQTYEVIQKEFYDLQIGVLDTNPDITYSVTIADAYIGESRSSVINLFLGIGKPIFILNNLIIDNYRQEEKHLVSIKDMCKVNNQWYILTEYNGIFGMNKDWENIERIHYFENEVNWEELYVKMIYEKQKLYLISLFKVECISYDFLQKNTNKIWNDGESTILDRNMFIFIYKNMICFVLGKKGKLITFDKNGNKIKEFSKGIELLKQSVQKNIFEEIFSAIQVGSCIWMVATYTNKVLCFDMETEQELIYSVGNENMGFSGIAEDG
ncbi:MAG: hypothetical protein IKJ01_07340, partial [Lachnospiraceae bacterium]|nr:hypothetical protein [Lachnospiraceae bacterium]